LRVISESAETGRGSDQQNETQVPQLPPVRS
jgi:hypothetical protein